VSRFPKSRVHVADRDWSRPLSHELQDYLDALFAFNANADSAPGDPTTVRAGISASPGTTHIAVPKALEDHIHPVETAEPYALSTVGGASSEGTSTALARADHIHDSTSLVVLAWLL